MNPPAPEQQPGDTEAGRIESLDERFGKIEHEQAEQRGLLETIAARVGAARDDAHGQAAAQTKDRLEHPPAETIADQVRRAVADVDAERQQRESAAAHEAHHQELRELAEQQPREMVSGFRGRLQRAMFGADR